MRQRHRRNIFGYKFYIFLLCLIIFLIVVINFKFLVVKKVDVEGNVSCIWDKSLINTNSLLGQNFFLASGKKLKAEIQNKYICVGAVDLKKVFPSTFKIQLSQRQPKIEIININREASESALMMELIADASASANIILENVPKRGFFLADDNGVIYSDYNGESLPKVYFWQNLQVGQKIEGNLIQNIIKIIDLLGLLGVNMNGLVLNSDNTLFVYSNPKIYFDLKGNLDSQLVSLQLILKTAKIYEGPAQDSGKVVVYIDLRFDKPVIKYTPK